MNKGKIDMVEEFNKIFDLLKTGWMTHGGVFHADDVFATALIKIVFARQDYPVRCNAVPEDYEGLVYDIGGGEFDHHQDNCKRYPDGRPMASFGLLAKPVIIVTYGMDIYEELLYFIQDIDENDNLGVNEATGQKNPIAILVKDYMPTHFDEGLLEEAFVKAVSFAENILRLKIIRAQESIKLRQKVVELPIDHGCIYLPTSVPSWSKYVTSANYAIYPSLRGGYNLQVSNSNHNQLPSTWLNRKPDGCTFVHKSLFLAAFESLEAARNAMISIGSH